MTYALMAHQDGSGVQFAISHKGMRDLVSVLRDVNMLISDDDDTGGRVPEWLFGSNVGWHLTPDYCHLIVQALDGFHDATDPAWEATVKQFTSFVQACVDLDGFDVW